MDERQIQVQDMYRDIADRSTAAYEAAKRIYEAQNPFPAERTIQKTDIMIVLAVLVIVTASTVVSGSRTIVEFGGGLIGVSAFVMIELSVVMYSFYRTRISWNKERIEGVKSLVKYGLIATVLIAIVANVHATLKASGVIFDERIQTVILIVIGISAPGLAWVSGDILGIEYMRYIQNSKDVDEANLLSRQEWYAGLNDKFARDSKKWGVSISVQPDNTVQNQLSSGQMSGQYAVQNLSTVDSSGQDSGQKVSSRTSVKDMVWTWLDENPEALKNKLSSRDLGDILGVSKSAIAPHLAEYKRLMKEGNNES